MALSSTDFALRYDRWYLPLATALWLGPNRTVIRVADGMLTVKNGWAFSIQIPLTSITSAKHVPERPMAWGVHASGDGWLVNGSRDGIVEIRFTPMKPKNAPWTAGTIRQLLLSVTDPDGLIAAVPHIAA
ncbi:hypothetical protein [Mycobacterium sp. NPDC050853]|uniref:hypothetical protein n=1 Tax=Mycobacteriaceae TaxID=1762 RepID=UPI0015DDEB2C|nr:hypothetical protein [Mycobacteroides sp. LB1]